MKTAARHLVAGSFIPARVSLRAPSTPLAPSHPSPPSEACHRQAPCGKGCEPRGGRGYNGLLRRALYRGRDTRPMTAGMLDIWSMSGKRRAVQLGQVAACVTRTEHRSRSGRRSPLPPQGNRSEPALGSFVRVTEMLVMLTVSGASSSTPSSTSSSTPSSKHLGVSTHLMPPL